MARKKIKRKKTRKLKERFEFLHRYFTGLSVIAIILTIVGSIAAGTSILTMVFRALQVFATLFVLEYIIIRVWASSEEMRRSVSSD